MVIRWFEKHRNLSIVITIIIAITIFYMSSLTFPPGPEKFNIKPMLYHLFIFFLFALFLLICLVNGKKRNLFFVLVILISIFYSLSDEIHQFFVPGRSSSLADVGLDTIGILFAFMIYFISIKYRETSSKISF